MPTQSAPPLMPRPRKPSRPPKPRKRPPHKRLTPPPAQLCPPDYRAFLACDWADQAHDFRLWDPLKGEITSFHIESKPEVLQPFLLDLKNKLAGTGHIGVIVESHQGSFINQVRDLDGYILHPINPKAAAKYRQALHPSGAKSDPIDVDTILRFGLLHPESCPALAPETPATRQLARLSEVRRQLVNESTAVSNRLTAVLKGYFPQALELCGELDRPLAWAFLERWPSLQAAQKAKPATFKKFYYQHNARRSEKIDQRIEVIKTARPLSTDPVLACTEPLQIQAFVSQLKAINQAVTKYDKLLEEMAPQHPDYALFRSVPGAGAALTPRLIGLFGTERQRWSDALSLLTYTGVAPIIKSSGQETSVHHRSACPKFARQTLIELASTSYNVGCGWVVDYVHSRQEKGWRYPRILRGVAFKWGRVLWKMWQEGSLYDETKMKNHEPQPNASPQKEAKSKGAQSTSKGTNPM